METLQLTKNQELNTFAHLLKDKLRQDVLKIARMLLNSFSIKPENVST